MSTTVHPTDETKWRQWWEHPEKTGFHRALFQLHLWLGMLAGMYVFVMSLTGSAIVFRNQVESAGPVPSLEWIVNLHENLLSGMVGRAVNGFGAICLTVLCITGAIIWWPGIIHWRRSLTVSLRASFARINWDLHNALGFWLLLFVLLWGVSGIYFVLPDPFNAVVDLFESPNATARLRVGDVILLWLSNLHFGRFNGFTEALWTVLGLVPAVLSFTGIFMCCHRIFVRKGTPLHR